VFYAKVKSITTVTKSAADAILMGYSSKK